MSVALAHDYVTQRGGAERVVLELCRNYPGAPLHTALYEPASSFPEFGRADLRLSSLQRYAAFRRDPRLALPFLAGAWDRMRVADGTDVVIASSSGWAHGIPVPAGVPKIVYCHNPARWLYQPADYLRRRAERFAMTGLRASLRRWDQQQAASVTRYVANSTVVAERIWQAYGARATVIHPPVSIDVHSVRQPVAGLRPGEYLLTVNRGRGYKNVEAVVEGVSGLLGLPLAVVGQLPSAEQRAVVGSDRAQWLGFVSDAELRWLYANARALVTVAHEDFGLTPIEANAFGTPVVALRAGGFLDTVVENVSGVWVEEPTAEAVAAVVADLPEFDRELVARNADRFSREHFHAGLDAVIKDVVNS